MYAKAAHGVSKGDFRRYGTSYFASYRKQVKRLPFGAESTIRITEQEHTIRAVWIYMMVMKTVTYETPFSRANDATLVVRRTSLTPTDDA